MTAGPPAIGDNSLAELAARINDAHVRAIEHAGKALEHAIACGDMLSEAKAKVPHGQWLPWLRRNVTFGERSAQGYMRLACNRHIRNGVADLSVRDALQILATPRRHALDAELEAWTAQCRAADRKPVEDWTVEDARACAERIRALDLIMHRYGICPDIAHPEPACLICGAALDAECAP